MSRELRGPSRYPTSARFLLLIAQCGFGVQNWAPQACLKQKGQPLKRGLELQEPRGSEIPDPAHCPGLWAHKCSHNVKEANLFVRHCLVHSCLPRFHMGHLCPLCHCALPPGNRNRPYMSGRQDPALGLSFSCFPRTPCPPTAPTLKFLLQREVRDPAWGKGCLFMAVGVAICHTHRRALAWKRM